MLTAVSTRLWNMNFQDGRGGLLGQVAMVSKGTNRGLALKRGRRVNCLLLPTGIVSRSSVGGVYGNTKRSLQKVIGRENGLS